MVNPIKSYKGSHHTEGGRAAIVIRGLDLTQAKVGAIAAKLVRSRGVTSIKRGMRTNIGDITRKEGRTNR